MVFALIRPSVDTHTLGIHQVSQLLDQCGVRVLKADAEICSIVNTLHQRGKGKKLAEWLRGHGVTHLGFSFRLDPGEGLKHFAALMHCLREYALVSHSGARGLRLFFAGLPETCRLIRDRFGPRVEVFSGHENEDEVLEKLGIPLQKLPAAVRAHEYDKMRLSFGEEFVKAARYSAVRPQPHSGYAGFGTMNDHVFQRISQAQRSQALPLLRAHVGPYSAERDEVFHVFLHWVEDLAKTGWLDVLSIGTSQLTQSHFGEQWGNLPNGGGIPINSEEEFRAVWIAARPMLVRTYAGTTRMLRLAELYERNVNIAWHALSLWWFCQIDGRGPLSVRENLQEHTRVLRFAARTGKPFEPNIPHHFTFRGGDDATYVISAVLAARLARRLGIRYFILQNMLNTPRFTWGVQDLAKSRVMLRYIRHLEDSNFQVVLQPRAGLDYFSSDLHKARVQLAAVTALMDDIEPGNCQSPEIIHVVSYSEGSFLANPSVVNESCQITLAALHDYRRRKLKGDISIAEADAEAEERAFELRTQCDAVLTQLETSIPDLYSPEGLYWAFKAGFLIAPELWHGREEFREAVRWNTRLVHGGVHAVDAGGHLIPAKVRAEVAADLYRRHRLDRRGATGFQN